MPTNVQYKGNLLTTINNNQSKILNTAGKYMEGDIIISDATYLQGDKVVTPTSSIQYVVPDDWTFIAGGIVLNDYVDSSTSGIWCNTTFSFPQNFDYENSHRYIGELTVSVTGITQHIFIDADVSIAATTAVSSQNVPFKFTGDDFIKRVKMYYGTSSQTLGFSFEHNTTSGNKTYNFYINVYDTSNSIYDGLSHVKVDAASSTPTGNINITHSGQTDVTNYATATVPSAEPFIDATSGFSTVSGVRKWSFTPNMSAGLLQGKDAGWAEGFYEGNEDLYNAVPANTTVTPSTSAQTIGGANYMMEGAVTVAAMPSGTAGTPTATKGTVSNHTISVTPSVTNTTGYITGGTKTGTAVSVSANELVSGTYTVSSSGTADVTNYASISVPTASLYMGHVNNFYTESNTRKWHFKPFAAVSIGDGYGTPGFIADNTVFNGIDCIYNAIPANTVIVPNTTTQTIGGAEYMMEGAITVNPIPSQYIVPSGNLPITQNGTNIDVTNYATVSVAVEGSGSGGSGTQIGIKTVTPATASASISFTGLSGEPTSFVVISNSDLATGASPYKTAAVVWDGSSLHGQTITNTNNAQVSYDGSGFSKSYSNGTLTITGIGTYFQNNQYTLMYSYGGTAASIDTADVQVGSGATSITFTGLSEEPTAWSCIFKSNFSTSSGYQRVIAVVYDGNDTYGMEMDSSAHYNDTHWSYTYNNGSLTISSQGTNQGGYFHQPGYYQLTAIYGGEVEPIEIEIEPLNVTQNGTYTAPTGKAYSPVTVNISGGGVQTDTKTVTASNNPVSLQFTGMKGQPKMFTVKLNTSVSSSGSTTYYYIVDITSHGTTTHGNCFRIGSTRQVTSITSGYSWSYSGTTLTITSSAASRSASPGAFYNGSYELMYVY